MFLINILSYAKLVFLIFLILFNVFNTFHLIKYKKIIKSEIEEKGGVYTYNPLSFPTSLLKETKDKGIKRLIMTIKTERVFFYGLIAMILIDFIVHKIYY